MFTFMLLALIDEYGSPAEMEIGYFQRGTDGSQRVAVPGSAYDLYG